MEQRVEGGCGGGAGGGSGQNKRVSVRARARARLLVVTVDFVAKIAAKHAVVVGLKREGVGQVMGDGRGRVEIEGAREMEG